MEEQINSKQPQFATPAKNPKRVVRTYQSDLAKLGKSVAMPKNAPKQEVEKKKVPAPDVAKAKKIPTPTPKKKAVELPEENLQAAEKKHYLEEITSTESIDLANTKSFTKEDIEQIINTPPEDKVAPAKPKPPIVTIEESSTPKKSFVEKAMTWLMGGTGKDSVSVSKSVSKEKISVIPPKKLEGIPVIPKAPTKKEAVAPVQKVTPPKIVLPQKDAPQVSKNALFAPPKQVTVSVPEVSLPPQMPVEQKDFKKPSPLSTYTSDARRGIKKQKDTRLSVLAKQQDSKKSAPKKRSLKKKQPIVAIAIILLVLGVGALAGTFYFLSQDTAPVATPTRVVTPVFAENRTRISASSIPTLSNLADLLSSVPTPFANALTHVTFSIPTEIGSEVIPFSDILLESPSVPGTLARSVYPQSMLGVLGEEKEPVLVLAVTSFERSFKSLLSWEADMPNALRPLFGELDVVPVSTTTPPYIQQFVDEEIETSDARILYDANGDTYLIYGFVTPNILFITRTKEAFLDLADRIVRE